eukprot:COSAG01_NODE_1318_length_10746_cov_96.891425_15_plen_34_part_00
MTPATLVVALQPGPGGELRLPIVTYNVEKQDLY